VRINRSALVGVGVMALGALGGGTAAPVGATTVPSGDCELADVPIGAALSLTGGAAAYGESQQRGLELARDELNERGGITYDLRIEDDGTEPTQGISVFEGFVGDDVAVIIGPTLSNGAMQADPVAQESGVPVLGISNTAAGVTDIGDYVFRDSLTEGAVIPQTIAAAQAEFGLEQVVVMYANDDAFTQSGYDAFASALDEAGIEVADTLTFSTADTDFAALLTQAQESEPDAIVVSALVEAAIPLVTQAREAGIDVPIIGGNGFNSPQLMADAGDAAEGVVVGAAWNSSSDNPENTAFLEAYRQAYDADPDQFAAQAYTGLYLIDAAIAVECSIDHEVLRDSLAGLADVPTVLGSFSFDENRDAVHPAVVQIVEDGAFVVLGGEEAAGGTAAGGDTAPADSATSDGTEVMVTGDTEPADTSSSDTDTASATTHG